MSQYYANDNPVEVATYREIAFIFVIFAFILYMLYPDKMQRNQVLNEDSNYALASIYLENMLRLEPENIDLLLATTEASLENGNIDLAENLIKVLKKSENISMKNQNKLNLLIYNILKIKNHKNSKSKQILKNKIQMKNILDKVIKEKSFDKKDALLWYSEAIYLKDNEAAFIFLKPLIKENNIYALEQCVYLEVDDKYRKDKLHCAQILSQQEESKSEKWLMHIYTIYIQDGEEEKALKVMKRLVDIDIKYKTELARIQEVAGKHRESANTYMQFYENNDDIKVKNHYLNEAISVLISGNLSKDAVILMKKYEDRYLHNDEMIQKFIKLYLSMDELEAARQLSIKLLHEGEDQ